MIPPLSIRAWRSVAPWRGDDQVEHDLVLSRALVDIFSDEYLAERLALRGGTALHKLFFDPARRFSEDIDLVQVVEVPEAKEMFRRIRGAIEPWLGEAQWKQAGNMMTLDFRFETEIAPVVRRKLKVEIHCREHFTVLGLEAREFGVESEWFRGRAQVPVYQLDELMGTKLRALYQRKRGRDLFDLATVLTELEAQPERILECFRRYLEASSPRGAVSAQQLVANVEAKLGDPRFEQDILNLLPPGTTFEARAAWEAIAHQLFGEEP